jgi:hypothetical protein
VKIKTADGGGEGVDMGRAKRMKERVHFMSSLLYVLKGGWFM